MSVCVGWVCGCVRASGCTRVYVCACVQVAEGPFKTEQLRDDDVMLINAGTIPNYYPFNLLDHQSAH